MQLGVCMPPPWCQASAAVSGSHRMCHRCLRAASPAPAGHSPPLCCALPASLPACPVPPAPDSPAHTGCRLRGHCAGEVLPPPVKVIGEDEYGAAGTTADSTALASANRASAPNGNGNGASSSGTGNGYGNSAATAGGNVYGNGASSGTGGEYSKKAGTKGTKYGKEAEVEAVEEEVMFEPLVCKVRRCVQEGGGGGAHDGGAGVEGKRV